MGDTTGESAPTGGPTRRAVLLGSAAAALAATAGCADTTARHSATGPPTTVAPVTTTAAATGGPATFVSHGPTDVPKVALTFHTNGDVALAHQLLDVLDARKVRVTTFVVGNWLEQHPDWAKRLVDGGHELSNHTYSHQTFSRLDAQRMAEEVTRCRDVLIRTSGAGGDYFRPSGTANGTDSPTAEVLAVAGTAGYPTVLGYDVDPADYQDPGSTEVTRRTIAGLHAGAIVSLHFGHQGTVQAMPAILDAIGKQGLAAVTAGELLT